MSAPDFTVKVEFHSPDAVFVAGFLRDGEPWILNGALVGMGGTREEAVTSLTGIARYLVLNGENFLTDAQLPLADRQWLFAVLDQGPLDDEMYAALRAAQEAAR